MSGITLKELREAFDNSTHAEDYVENGHLAVVTTGNGFRWSPDSWIILPLEVADALAEATALDLEGFGTDADSQRVGDYTVYEYHLAR